MSFIAFYISFSLPFLSYCLCLKQKHFLNVLYNQIGIKFMTLQCLSELFLGALASRYRIQMSSEMDNMIPLRAQCLYRTIIKSEQKSWGTVEEKE